jgi:LAO/AO transport system kinase
MPDRWHCPLGGVWRVGCGVVDDAMVERILAGDHAALGQAITLVESTRPDHFAASQELLARLLPHTGGSHRIGITGVPGVGKSTFIDQFGTNLTAAGHRVAVLAVDPTSQRTGGSILGDKTRMERLANDPAAFVRPSPAGSTLGGVTRTTRETILLCEAAGFDVVLVETVGVGQSETMVADMVDFFLVLMLAGAGDELQGIKRGVLELADMIAVNKADGDNIERAQAAAADYRMAMHLMAPASPTWTPPVVTCSALTNEGLEEIWSLICQHRQRLDATGELAARRADQRVRWMWSMVEDRVLSSFRASVADLAAELEAAVHAGTVPPTAAAEQLVDSFDPAKGKITK